MNEKEAQEVYAIIEKHLRIAVQEIEKAKAIATKHNLNFKFDTKVNIDISVQEKDDEDWEPSREEEDWVSSEPCW